MKIRAAKIAITTPIIAGLIFSKPWIPLIPDAIEFDCADRTILNNQRNNDAKRAAAITKAASPLQYLLTTIY